MMQRWRYGVLALAVVTVNAGLPPVREVGITLLSGRIPPVKTAEQIALLAWVGVVVAVVAYLSFSYVTGTPPDGV